ncbi:hypothetical protein [Alicyclobacillus sp. SO9]|uniref:hypothetical protein n=1 Tax=Alicyclobacillus sp. SO9 TaxID=2665646 RepID=UPI0018E7FC87|nr:hypothetical protein [Alicyclobacillus sp. SO9]QQE80114.1 hypothetical protein GI364_06665 [Alicyclobacillus sp. SO9]
MEHDVRTTLLQLRYPQVHRQLIEEFQKIGLQSYDVKAEVLEQITGATDSPNEITIRIRFGETFTEFKDLTLNKNLETAEFESITKFLKECAQSAHETLKNEYKRSMNIGLPRKNDNGL